MAGENAADELDKYIDDNFGTSDTTDVSDNSNGQIEDNGALDTVTDANQQTDQQPKQDNLQADDSAGQQPKNDATKGQQPKQSNEAPKTNNLRPLGDGAFADQQGNIVDQSGKIIAERGFAARMYNTNRRLKSDNEQMRNQLEQVVPQLREVQSLASTIRQYNLSNDDMAVAIDMAAKYKRGDYLGVAKEVLAMVVAQGYNVTDLLGNEVGDSIEMRGIHRMIDERLAPITRQEQARQQQQQREQAGAQAYNDFVRQNQYADVHGDAIAHQMRNGMSAQQAYNQLREFAYDNGFDFSQDLGPQIAARRQQPQQQQQQRQQPKPMPNGAATRAVNGANGTVTELAGADDSWGSIIKSVQATIGNA